MSGSDFLTLEDLAARWHRGERSIADDIRAGSLVAHKNGRRWLVRLSDAEAFEQARANIARTPKRTRRPRARRNAA